MLEWISPLVSVNLIDDDLTSCLEVLPMKSSSVMGKLTLTSQTRMESATANVTTLVIVFVVCFVTV